MNKKILLGTLLTSSVLTAALVAPKAMAATIDGNGSKLTGSINSGKISVVLPSANDKVGLTKDALVKLINEKCGKDIVESIKKADGTEITEGNVGTGAVVELTSGSKLTVVLYGDANGNGKVNMYDAVAIAQHRVGNEMLKDDYLLASELTDAIDEKLELNDSTRVACYDVKLVGTEARYGITLVDEALYPVDEIVIPDEVVTGAIDDLKEYEEFKFDFNAETNEVTCQLLSADSKISDFVGKGTGIISKLVEQLQNPNVKDVVISLGDKTVTLPNGATSKDVLNAAKTLLGNNFDISIINLAGKELKATINFEDSNSVVENGDILKDSTKVEYTLKFVADAKSSVEEVFEDLNKSSDAFDVSFSDENSNEVNFSISQESKDKTTKEVFGDDSEVKQQFVDLVADYKGGEYKDVVSDLESVTIKLGDKTCTLTSGETGKLDAVNEMAKELLGCEIVRTENGGFDLKFDDDTKKMSDLISKELNVEFNFKDGINKDELMDKYNFDFEKGLKLLFQ